MCLFSFSVKGPPIVPCHEIRRYASLSLALNNAMDDTGASLNVRKTKTVTATSSEILQTISIYPKAVYIFGSWYEGSSVLGLGADIDNAIISDCFPVVTQASDFQHLISYLLINDKQPGYVRLQLLHDGKPMSKESIQEIDDTHNELYVDKKNNVCLIQNKDLTDSIYELDVDKTNRFCLMQNLEKVLSEKRRTREGPAMHDSGSGGRMPTDTVNALRCKSWPKCASKWLTRRRKFGWPTPEMIHKYKSLGFLMVQACHPNSDEKKFQWRIAFSEQERSLVTQFNATQHKCYILLKIIKKEMIKKHLKKDTLTSYHFKTCLFYMIENTPNEIWIPECLADCVIMCMKQIYLWAKKCNIPNYFIPRENMFDRIRDKDLKLKLTKLLECFLHSDIRSVLQNLETNKIGSRLSTYLDISVDNGAYFNISANRSRSDEHYSQIHALDILLSDLIITRNRILDLQPILIHNKLKFTRNVNEYIQDLMVILNHVKCKQITNHSESETREATSLIIPFIELTALSCIVANGYYNMGGMLGESLTDKWDMLDPINNSAKIKQACAKFMLEHEASSADLLLSITNKEVSCCRCNPFSPGVRNKLRVLKQVTEHRPNITAMELIRDYMQPCIVFLPFEKAITPIAIDYEMVRSYALPYKLYEIDMKETHWFRWGVVDGRFLVHFLLYLNHKVMDQLAQCALDITRMISLLDSKSVHHRETCLNLLGWVHKDRGNTNRAAECFIKSLEINRLCNAAYWHMCFLISERFN